MSSIIGSGLESKILTIENSLKTSLSGEFTDTDFSISCEACSSTATHGRLLPRAGTVNSENRFVNDPHSFARPWEAKVKHMDLHFSPNFHDKILTGRAIYTYQAAQGAQQLRLDIKNVNITKVETANSTPLTYTLSETDPLLGGYIAIGLPKDNEQIIIEFTTSPNAEGLYWNNNTLFTHSQPIYTRSWLPCQDTPIVRSTFTAQFDIPDTHSSLMSCQNNPRTPKERTEDFSHVMKIPLPSYLIAFALGEYSYHATGPRTGIYANSMYLEQAKKEYSHLEKILEKAEAIFGPYGDWVRYDMLIVSSDFPASATENPCLTFFGPVILSGDGSNVYVLCHEIAHSCSGNKTTAAGWEHLWLNEGCTTYFENRIVEDVEGVDAAVLLAHLYYYELIDEFIDSKPEDQCLRLNLSGRNPRDSFASTAYYKGFLFLKMLERNIGRQTLTEFMIKYFNAHKYKSVTTEAFEVYLDEHLLRNDTELKEKLCVQEWLYKPGIPENVFLPSSEKIAEVTFAREGWLSGGSDEKLKMDTKLYTLHEWRFFLLGLKDQPAETLRRLDSLCNLKEHPNLYIREPWLFNALVCEYCDVLEDVVKFVLGTPKPGTVKKYMNQLIKMNTPETLAAAKAIYDRGIAEFSTRARDALKASMPIADGS